MNTTTFSDTNDKITEEKDNQVYNRNKGKAKTFVSRFDLSGFDLI